MTIVLIAFTITALVLAIGGLIAMRSKGELSAVSNVVGRFLLFMALGTAVFPAFFPVIGVTVWIVAYVAFVIAMTTIIVVKATRASH